MKKRLAAILLLWFCMLMQAVSVLPHHHHDDFLCLDHDVKASRTARADNACTPECITHFSVASLSCRVSIKDTKPDTRLQHFLLSECNDGTVLLTPCLCRQNLFRTVAYSSRTIGSAGLRSPPFSSVA